MSSRTYKLDELYAKTIYILVKIYNKPYSCYICGRKRKKKEGRKKSNIIV